MYMMFWSFLIDCWNILKEMREFLYDINSTDVPVAISLLVASYRFKKQTTRPRRQNEQCTAGRVMGCREGSKLVDEIPSTTVYRWWVCVVRSFQVHFLYLFCYFSFAAREGSINWIVEIHLCNHILLSNNDADYTWNKFRLHSILWHGKLMCHFSSEVICQLSSLGRISSMRQSSQKLKNQLQVRRSRHWTARAFVADPAIG